MTGKLTKLAIAAIFSALLVPFSGPAQAQEFIPPAASEPPYEAQFLRLSEILGAIHYLRELCDSDEDGLWRDQMLAIIDAEAPSPVRRARIVDRFNRGFESFRSVYRTCTPAATAAIDRYMDEGVKIARDITVRYGK